MSEKDWETIADVDEETWSALPEATRRAIHVLQESREKDEATPRKLRKKESGAG